MELYSDRGPFTDELVPRCRTPTEETVAATATETRRQEIVAGRPVRIVNGTVRGRQQGLCPVVRLRR